MSQGLLLLCVMFSLNPSLLFYLLSALLVWSLFLADVALAISIQEAFEDGTWYLYEQFAESNGEPVSAVTSQLHWFVCNGACLPPRGL